MKSSYDFVPQCFIVVFVVCFLQSPVPGAGERVLCGPRCVEHDRGGGQPAPRPGQAGIFAELVADAQLAEDIALATAGGRARIPISSVKGFSSRGVAGRRPAT